MNADVMKAKEEAKNRYEAWQALEGRFKSMSLEEIEAEAIAAKEELREEANERYTDALEFHMNVTQGDKRTARNMAHCDVRDWMGLKSEAIFVWLNMLGGRFGFRNIRTEAMEKAYQEEWHTTGMMGWDW